MNKDRRTFLRQLGLGGLIVSPAVLAACGGNAPATGGASPTAGRSAATTALAVDTAASPPAVVATGGTTITVLIATLGRLEAAFKKIAPAVEQQLGLTIEQQIVPFSELDRTIRSIQQQPTPPDVILCGTPYITTYVANDLLLPMTQAFTQADLDDFFPGTTVSALINGEFYGPGTNESSQAIYYNKAILDKYGITPPQTLAEAWTWPQALEMFKEVQVAERTARSTDQFWAIYPGQGGFGGGNVDGVFYTAANIYRSNGEPGSPTFKSVSDDGLTATGYINTPEALEGLQFLQTLFQKEGVAPISDTADFFVNEQVAFWIATPFQYATIIESNLDLQLGITPFPYLKTPIVQTGAFHWVVNKQTQAPEAATAFVQYLGSAEGNRIVAEEFTSIPIRQSLVETFPNFAPGGILRPFVDTVAEWAQPRPLTPGYSEYQQIAGQMIVDIIKGADVKATADRAAAEIDRQLRRYA